jgi:cobalamin biosynthesis protein CobD/CbiB
MKEKPYFGDGKQEISAVDVQRALTLQWKLDTLMIIVLAAGVMA